MRVLILEPDLTGHHAPYLRQLVDSLSQLEQDVVVLTGPGATASPQFALHLRDVAGGVEFDETVPFPAKSLYGFASGQFGALQGALGRHRPDHVWVPYADLLTEYLAARAIAWGGAPWPARVEAEGLYFRGRFAYPVERWQKHFTRTLARHLIPRSPWNVLHWLDPLAYDILRRECPQQAARFRLMPDPVEAVAPMDRRASRAKLGIAPEGRFAGCVGVLNRRKGVDLLLAGFRRATLGSTDRLLLAGPMDNAMRELVNREYDDLVRAGRIVAIDRHLNVDDVMSGVMACDVVCVPNPYQMGSSSFVIRAATARRPVLATDFGWMGWAVRKFGLGWTANVWDAAALGATMREAMDQAAGWSLPAIAERFVRYHSAENFQAHWTARLRERLQLPPDERLIAWETVLEAGVATI